MSSLFCMEVFVDTVDYMQSQWSAHESDWPAEACARVASELVFMFPGGDTAPLVIPPPDARR
eukprot:CAMPEP_0182549636 /NCGR_PEP_ID=MMETSP1323-20130603/40457_1 /TAXON_ID=236787 /ORGANISM="Florenciella parvula, Strain RCC1693" /LENGTH=61 /DNA_ID=CAMNT_0024761113 /DNA_START=103 /DNA_END=285 /DNA_ORIENTATION=+